MVTQKRGHEDIMTQNRSAALKELSITHKGILQTRILSAALKGRERQFMLLLLHNDDISQQACLAMLPKIDVDSLIARGFLKYENNDENKNVPDTTQITQVRESATAALHQQPSDDTIDPAINPVIDPILQLAAGKVH